MVVHSPWDTRVRHDRATNIHMPTLCSEGRHYLIISEYFFLIYWSVADLQCVLVSAVQHCESVKHISTLKKKIVPHICLCSYNTFTLFPGNTLSFSSQAFCCTNILEKIVCIKGLLMPLSWMCKSLQVIISH